MEETTAGQQTTTVEVKKLGRPRKLRETVSTNGTQSSTVVVKTETKKETFLPYRGKESLVVNEERYFVNGRKLLAIVKKQFGKDEKGNPVYKIVRRLRSMIYDGTPRGAQLRATLKECDVPGA